MVVAASNIGLFGGNNWFIARMQGVLCTRPHGFYKLEGADALQAGGATTRDSENPEG